MEMERLVRAVNELLAAESPKEAEAALSRHPELLDEESIYTLRSMALEAREEGEKDIAEVLERTATWLADMPQPIREAILMQPDQTAAPATTQSTAGWTRLARQYLALRKAEFLDQAIAETQGDKRIAGMLRALQQEDVTAFGDIALQLHFHFLANGSDDEHMTLALIESDWATALVKLYQTLPLEEQIPALDAAIDSSREASELARTLGDHGCLAFYKTAEGIGWTKRQRPDEAERAYREAVELYRGLAQQQPHYYEARLALALTNFAVLLNEQKRFAEAEGASREALELYRKLAEKDPQTYERDVEMTLNNLGTLRSTRRMDEIENAR